MYSVKMRLHWIGVDPGPVTDVFVRGKLGRNRRTERCHVTMGTEMMASVSQEMSRAPQAARRGKEDPSTTPSQGASRQGPVDTRLSNVWLPEL